MEKKAETLLHSLRQKYAASHRTPDVATTRPEPARLPHDFRTHRLYREVEIAKQTGVVLGIRSPFFRTTEEVRGTQVRINGRWVENFASYDYLGLNQSDIIAAAVAEAAARWGVSATASRLVGGERSFHLDLEREIAGFLGVEDAIAMVSGHATNVATISTLVGANDLVLVDALAHNSIFEGIKASGAAHLAFPHNDWEWVEAKLAAARGEHRNVLIVVEGLYSMHGDIPDIARFVEVKNRHDAWLMIDEAHSIGVLGRTGRGVREAQAIPPEEIEVTMGTLSKAFCSCGGFIAGSSGLVDLLRYRASGFVFSVGLSAPDAHAAMAALSMLRAEPERVTALRSLSAHFHAHASALGLDTGSSAGFAVAPVVIGDSIKATLIANEMLDAGFNVLPIIAPAVPDRNACLRFFITANHDRATIDRALETLAGLVARHMAED